jgi:hypothetical protein
MNKNTFESNKGRIQEILKENPELECKRRENQLNAISQGNKVAAYYKAYYEYAEQTNFTQAWIEAVTDANVFDPGIRQTIGEEILRQQIATIGMGGYYEARNGWVPDYALCKARLALIKFLLSGAHLPPYPPYKKRGRKPKYARANYFNRTE